MFQHDPARQVRFLRESIQLGKKPLGLFLGAGCPLAIKMDDGQPLIPDLKNMTNVVVRKLSEQEKYKKSLEILRKHFDKEVTLEHYLSHLRSLIDVCGGEVVRGLSCDQMITLERAICDEIYNLVNVKHPNTNGPYQQLSQWIRSANREHNVEIFTTNYDLLVEQALEQKRVPFFDGFIGSVAPFFDPYAIDEEAFPSRWAGLWKLHGSINWKYDEGERAVVRGDMDKIAEKERRLIHPSHLKYSESRRMPYLAMLDKLKAFLNRPSCLLITSGYSFADEHINEVIRQGLERNISAQCFALAFGDLNDYPEAKKIAKNRSNLSLLAGKSGFIGGREAAYVTSQEDVAVLDAEIGVKWVPSTSPGPAGEEDITIYNAILTLGDFAEFGTLLADIVGDIGPYESYGGEGSHGE